MKKEGEKRDMQKLNFIIITKALKQKLLKKPLKVVPHSNQSKEEPQKIEQQLYQGKEELHNSDSYLETLTLINILSDAYYSQAKYVSFFDNGDLITDNGFSYHIDTGLIPIAEILNKLQIYYSSNDNSIMIALTSFGDNYEGENRLCQ